MSDTPEQTLLLAAAMAAEMCRKLGNREGEIVALNEVFMIICERRRQLGAPHALTAFLNAVDDLPPEGATS